MYKSLYEDERAYRIKLEKASLGSFRASLNNDLESNLNVYLMENFLKHVNFTGYMMKTDLKIIEYLVKHGLSKDDLGILYAAHCIIVCMKENERLQAEKDKLKEKVKNRQEEIQSLQDHILRDPSIPL